MPKLIVQLLAYSPAITDAVKVRLRAAALLNALKRGKDGLHTGEAGNGLFRIRTDLLSQVMHRAVANAAAS